MSENKRKPAEEIDYVFARYPLWIRYSGLPERLGAVAWSVFQRLLELKCRFDSAKFFYSIDRLCQTTGLSGIGAMRRVLKRLSDEGLISYKTSRGRGLATEFEIIEPIKTPTPEEEIYRTQPRLRPRSYSRRFYRDNNGMKTDQRDQFYARKNKSDPRDHFWERKTDPRDQFYEGESDPGDHFSGDKSDPSDHPLKRHVHEKDNNNKMDLFHEKGKNASLSKSHGNPTVIKKQEDNDSNVVVAININNLKEYGISGDDAKNFLKKYSQDYLREKIEIIEFKKSSGEEIRNIGGMLKKAIIGDWQPPPGFTTRAQRAQEARRKEEAEELAAREAEEKEERERMEHDRAKMAEEWKKGATQEELEEVAERARREILDENPGQNERWLAPMVRMREERIIAEKYAAGMHRVRRGH